ncbi:MAG: glucan biosynthesis glucosyltransferase H, partial [Acetobacteraceae bacterium]|nr:glucan biosynthesis glucosyltransferase H [Acetobacteraceae bacterium]
MDPVLSNGADMLRALPEDAPLAMPTQSLGVSPSRRARPLSSPRLIAFRRLLVIGSAIAMTVLATIEMYHVFAVNGLTSLAAIMLALFVVLFAWIALSFTSAFAGFISLLSGGGRP